MSTPGEGQVRAMVSAFPEERERRERRESDIRKAGLRYQVEEREKLKQRLQTTRRNLTVEQAEAKILQFRGQYERLMQEFSTGMLEVRTGLLNDSQKTKAAFELNDWLSGEMDKLPGDVRHFLKREMPEPYLRRELLDFIEAVKNEIALCEERKKQIERMARMTAFEIKATFRDFKGRMNRLNKEFKYCVEDIRKRILDDSGRTEALFRLNEWLYVEMGRLNDDVSAILQREGSWEILNEIDQDIAAAMNELGATEEGLPVLKQVDMITNKGLWLRLIFAIEAALARRSLWVNSRNLRTERKMRPDLRLDKEIQELAREKKILQMIYSRVRIPDFLIVKLQNLGVKLQNAMDWTQKEFANAAPFFGKKLNIESIVDRYIAAGAREGERLGEAATTAAETKYSIASAPAEFLERTIKDTPTANPFRWLYIRSWTPPDRYTSVRPPTPPVIRPTQTKKSITRPIPPTPSPRPIRPRRQGRLRAGLHNVKALFGKGETAKRSSKSKSPARKSKSRFWKRKRTPSRSPACPLPAKRLSKLKSRTPTARYYYK